MTGLPTKIKGSIWILSSLKTHIVDRFVLFYTKRLSWFQMLKIEASIRTSFYYICLENTSYSPWKLIRKIQGRLFVRLLFVKGLSKKQSEHLQHLIPQNILNSQCSVPCLDIYVCVYICMYVEKESPCFKSPQLKSDFKMGRGIRQPCFFIKICIILIKGKMRIIKLYSN